MKVYFGNESGEVVGTVLDQQFNQEAAGCYFYVPSFVVAMPDGTFKVVDIEKCKHKMYPDVAGNEVRVSENFLQMAYKKYGAGTDDESRKIAESRMLEDVAELLRVLPGELPDGDFTINHQRLLIKHLPNGDTQIGFTQGISVLRKEGNPIIADVYYKDTLLGSIKIKKDEGE